MPSVAKFTGGETDSAILAEGEAAAAARNADTQILRFPADR